MSNHRCKVTIGMPIYNGERFLGEALDSILAQTFEDFEVIISDNASTDRTEEICRAYEGIDPRVRYHRNSENFGAAYNYKRLFDLSRGEYFRWHPADDLCDPSYLASCVDVLDRDPSVVLVCSMTRYIDEKGEDLEVEDTGWNLQSDKAHERLRYVLYAGHLVNNIYGLIRSGALSKTRFFGNYPGGDYRLLAELSLLGKFYEIPESLFVRRFHPNASSQNTKNHEWQVEFYTGRRWVQCFPEWNLTVDHFLTIICSALGLYQKGVLLTVLLRRMRWRQWVLLEELKTACTIYLHRWGDLMKGKPG